MKLLAIIGNLGADAVVKEINGNKYLHFSVAVNDNYKDAQGNKIERVDWITVFSRQISLATYLRKGGKVYVQGNFSSRIYTNNNRQQSVSITINAQIIQLLGSKQEQGADTAYQAPEVTAVTQGDDDDLPF